MGARSKFLLGLAPAEKWTPSQWGENCRILGPDETSEPGPYSFDRTPYWRQICDMVAQPGIEEVIVLKGAQIGWSELCRIIMGYWVDLDPGPTLVLMPDQKSADDYRDERLEPLIRNTPAVSRHMSDRAWDTKKYRIKFDTMSIFMAWAGSKSGTKSRPIRYLVCEEPDEYPPFSSTGGDPLSKAMKRITTYSDKGRARVLIGGTPTTRMGNVFKRWEMASIKYHLWVPCPTCGGYQELLWKQVKWQLPEGDWAGAGGNDRSKQAEAIRSHHHGAGAWYECEHCQSHLMDHDKPKMLRQGIWASEDHAVTKDGRIVGPTPKARRVGFFLPSFYSPWVRWGDLAAEWLEAQGDPQTLCDFINQRLAQPYEEQRQKIKPDLLEAKRQAAGPGLTVPTWARLLVATADTQGANNQDGYFYYVIRAWGYGYQSQLVDFGLCQTTDELKTKCLDQHFAWARGGNVAPQMLLVDSGGPRWQEIYQLSMGDGRIHATKGANGARTWMVEERLQKKHGVVLWEIDTGQSKDLLHRLMTDQDGGKWALLDRVNEDYCKQMSAEAKVYNPTTRREEWVEIIKNNNHYWDCEHQQCAAAWRYGMGTPPPPETPAVVAGQGGGNQPDWMPDKPQGWAR